MAGGYQKPSNPAPVSGPGALARRTDGGPSQPIRVLPDARYGENKQFVDQQKAAPLAAAQQPGVRPVPREQALASLRSVTPDFYAPTQQPDVPVTDGAALGPGRGPDAIAPAQSGGQLQQILRQMAQFDPTGEVQRLLQSAIAQGL